MFKNLGCLVPGFHRPFRRLVFATVPKLSNVLFVVLLGAFYGCLTNQLRSFSDQFPFSLSLPLVGPARWS